MSDFFLLRRGRACVCTMYACVLACERFTSTLVSTTCGTRRQIHPRPNAADVSEFLDGSWEVWRCIANTTKDARIRAFCDEAQGFFLRCLRTGSQGWWQGHQQNAEIAGKITIMRESFCPSRQISKGSRLKAAKHQAGSGSLRYQAHSRRILLAIWLLFYKNVHAHTEWNRVLLLWMFPGGWWRA